MICEQCHGLGGLLIHGHSRLGHGGLGLLPDGGCWLSGQLVCPLCVSACARTFVHLCSSASRCFALCSRFPREEGGIHSIWSHFPICALRARISLWKAKKTPIPSFRNCGFWWDFLIGENLSLNTEQSNIFNSLRNQRMTLINRNDLVHPQELWRKSRWASRTLP